MLHFGLTFLLENLTSACEGLLWIKIIKISWTLTQKCPIISRLGAGWTIDSIFSLVKTLLLDWADVRNNSRIDKYSTSFHLLNGVWHDYHWIRLHGKSDCRFLSNIWPRHPTDLKMTYTDFDLMNLTLNLTKSSVCNFAYALCATNMTDSSSKFCNVHRNKWYQRASVRGCHCR